MALWDSLMIAEDKSIKEAMRFIQTSGLGVILIVDGQGKLVGLATDGDIRRGIIKGIPVTESIDMVSNKNPFYAILGLREQEIVRLMKTEGITVVPIVDENKVVRDVAFLRFNKLQFLSAKEISAKKVEKVLVTGGGGYIGSVLVRNLLKRGYKVKVLDLFIYGRDSLQELNDPHLEIIHGDTRHVETLTNSISDVDAVIHLAELVGDPACALSPKITQDINYLATMLVASVCKYYQVNRLIYTSSCSVYGGSGSEQLLSEDSATNPISLYARMKLNSENILREMSDENFLPTILRLSTVYGYSPRPRFDLVVNTLTAKAITEGEITIFGGDQWRPNVHVADVAKAIILVLEADLNKVGNQVFNVGHESQNYILNQLGQLIREEIPSAKLIVEDRKIDKRNYKASFRKIAKVLNYAPDYDIKQGVRELVDAFKKGKIKDYKDPIFSNVDFLQNKIL